MQRRLVLLIRRTYPQIGLLALLLVSSVLISVPTVHSTSRPIVQSTWTNVPPTIDGKFTTGDAWTTDSPSLTLLPSDGYPVEAYVYFMNDKTNLYIMVDAVGDMTDIGSDESLLFFNFTHPYRFALIGTSTSFTSSTGSCSPYTCPSFEGVVGFDVSPEGLTNHKMYEFSIPLANIGFYRSDSAVDISSPSWKGYSIVYDSSTAKDNVWPNGLIFSDVNTWGVLKLGVPQICDQIGSTPYWTCKLPLASGWNLISLPVVPFANASANSVDLLFNQTGLSRVTSVFTYTYTGKVASWQSCISKFAAAKWSCAGTLKFLVDANGYWVLTTSSGVVLTVVGSVIQPGSAPPSYGLAAGWNLVGYKPQPNPTVFEPASLYLSSIAGKYDPNNVWVYDSSGWSRGDGTSLVPGQSMWVLMAASAILRP